LVEGRPTSRARADGVLVLGGEEGAVFREFRLEDADISLATVRRLAPAVTLLGRVRGTGVLNGLWLNATYEGTLRYAHGSRPSTEASGVVRLDARHDTLGLSADLEFDSLRLESFRSTYPAFAVRGAWAGRLAFAGRLDSLAMRADLSGPAGALRGEGVVVLLAERKGMRRLDLYLRHVDASMIHDAAPATSLTGQVIGRGTMTADGVADFLFVTALDSTLVNGLTVDSGGAQIRVTDQDVMVDTLQVWGAALRLDVRGRLAFGEADRDTLRFLASTSSLAALEPVLAPVLGPLQVDESTPLPTGAAQLAGQVVGSVAAYQVVADLNLTRIRRGDLYVSQGGGTATFVSASRLLRFDGSVDSVQVGDVALAGIRLRLHGRPDSLNWQGRSRFGRDGAWLGGGAWQAVQASHLVTIDSLGVLLASGPWFIDTAATVVVDDSGLGFTGVTFSRARPPGRISVQGRLPFHGTADLVASIEALPVRDVWVMLQRDPERVGGELGGTVRLRGTARAPEAQLDLALRDGVFGEFRAPIVEASVAYAARELTGVVDLWRRGERILSVDLGLPVDLAFADVERRQLPGAIRIQAQARGVDLTLLEATTPMIRQMGGTLDAQVGVTGTWERPQLTGFVELRDGAVTYPALGVRHEQIDGRLRLAGDRIHVERLALRSGQGSAAIGGTVRLEGLTRPILDLTVNAREFRTIDVRDFLTLTATADLDLDGPLYNAVLSGNATATRGILYFADLVTKDIVNLQDTLFREFVDTTLLRRQGLGPEFESRFLDSLRIDSLSVEMGREFWLRSSEANIQLAGRVFVSKQRAQYRLDGALQTPRGSYLLQLGLGSNTREFTVTRGEVRYFGTPDLNADLDIDARHLVRTVRREDVMVFVHIGGTLYEPQLTLSSDIRPPISETEIISYLLVGAPSFQAGLGTSGFETRLISQQVLGALSTQLEYLLISDLGVPLDYLRLRPASGDFSGQELAVGKQFEVLGRTAFLTVSPRVCPRLELKQVFDLGGSLEFWMSRRWLVAASFDPVRGCETLTAPLAVRYQLGLDVFWETNY
jgi:autotransporter translocation and assembly factor TamB